MSASLKPSLIRFLRSLERYTHTDNLYVLRNGFFVFLNQSISILNGVGLYLIIGHFVPQHIYGEYKYLLSLYSLFSITTLTGMDYALINAVANGNEGSLIRAFRSKFTYGLIGSAASIALGGYYLWQGNFQLGLGLLALAALGPIVNASMIFGSYFTAKKQFSTLTKLSSLGTLLSFVGMAAAFIFLRQSGWLFVAFLITSLVSLIGFIIAYRSVQNQSVDPEMERYAFQLSGLDILSTLANNLDAVIAFHLLGSEALALYAIAIIPGDQLKGILKTITSIAAPKLVKREVGEIRHGIQRKLILFTLLSAIVVGLYILCAPLIFRYLLPNFQTAVRYSQIYSLSIILAMPANLLFIVFVSKSLKKELAHFNIISYSIQIALLGLGTWLYGIWGLILSRIVSRCIMLILGYDLFRRTKET